MNRFKRWGATSALLVVAALTVAACGDSDDDGDSADTSEEVEIREGSAITIGAFDFGESLILAEIYAQQLEANGFVVDRGAMQPGSPREILKPALEGGQIDLVPEYVGTLVTFLGGTPTSDGAENQRIAAELYAATGVTVLAAADEAENVNALVVTSELAEEHGLQTVGDLAEHAGTLTFGGPAECPERDFCIPGFRDVYGVDFGAFVPLDFGPRVTALEEGGIDVALLFSTDAPIAVNGWVVLEDDQGLQPAENIAPVVSTSIVDEYGDDLVNALNEVTERLTSESLAEMNADFQVDQLDAADIARDWLIENNLIEG